MELAESDDAADRAEAAALRARLLVERGDPASALSELSKDLELVDGAPAAFADVARSLSESRDATRPAILAGVLRRTGELDAALGVLARAVRTIRSETGRSPPGLSQLYTEAAELYLARGQPRRALRAARRATEATGAGTPSLAHLELISRAALRAGDYETARESTREHPPRARGHRHQADRCHRRRLPRSS